MVNLYKAAEGKAAAGSYLAPRSGLASPQPQRKTLFAPFSDGSGATAGAAPAAGAAVLLLPRHSPGKTGATSWLLCHRGQPAVGHPHLGGDPIPGRARWQELPSGTSLALGIQPVGAGTFGAAGCFPLPARPSRCQILLPVPRRARCPAGSPSPAPGKSVPAALSCARAGSRLGTADGLRRAQVGLPGMLSRLQRPAPCPLLEQPFRSNTRGLGRRFLPRTAMRSPGCSAHPPFTWSHRHIHPGKGHFPGVTLPCPEHPARSRPPSRSCLAPLRGTRSCFPPALLPPVGRAKGQQLGRIFNLRRGRRGWEGERC